MSDLLVDEDFRRFRFLFRNSKNLFAGKYFSKLKGQGVEFCDLKVYDFFDDVRKIDWNVTARVGEPFVREFLEEKDVTHFFLVDVSGSQFNKIEQVRRFVASLLFACSGFSDNFCLVLCRRDFLKVVPISKGRKHLVRCIYELSRVEVAGFSDLGLGLKFLLDRIKKCSSVLIFSDELEFSDEVFSFIVALRKRNKVAFFEFFNSAELEFDLGLEAFCDAESGEEVLYDLDDDEVYEIILKFNEKLKGVRRVVLRTGAKFFCFDCKFDVMDQMRREGFEI